MTSGTALPLFVVERYVPAPTVDRARVEAARLRAAARALRREGVRVRHLGSLLLPADETSFCLFESESLGAVRLVSERASLAYERIVSAVPVELLNSLKGALR
jgi:hypothetical protein